MGSAQIVKAQLRKTDLARTFDELSGDRLRVAWLGEIELRASHRRKDERTFGQLDERKIHRNAIGDASGNPQMLLVFGDQESSECIINGDDTAATSRFWLLETPAVCLRYL